MMESSCPIRLSHSMRAGLYIILFLALLSGISCSRSGNKSLFQTTAEPLVPVDSISLEKYGILLPSMVFQYKDWLVVKKHGDNYFDVINPRTDTVYHILKKGRGPQEVISITSVQQMGEIVYVFDINRNRMMAVNIESAINEEIECVIVDTVVYKPLVGDCRPFIIRMAENGQYATGNFPDKSWYVFSDKNGVVRSSIPRFSVRDEDLLTEQELAGIHSQSIITSTEGGEHVAVVLNRGVAISFAACRDGQLHEERRYVEAVPGIKTKDRYRNKHLVMDTKDLPKLCGIASNDQNVFILYGRKDTDALRPGWVGKGLFVFDWSGNMLRYFVLDRYLGSLTWSQGRLMGVTSYPEAKVYIYDLGVTNPQKPVTE